MKKYTKTVPVLLFIAFFILFSAGCQDVNHEENKVNRAIDPSEPDGENPEDIPQRDAKIYANVSIEDDFDDSTLVVILDNFTSGVNKEHEEGFFGSFEKEYVQDLTIITENFEKIDEKLFRQIFGIKLPKENAGKEQVLSAIRELERIEGIRYAGPNIFSYPAKAPNDIWYSYGYQWGLNSYYGIQAEDAWEITTGSRNMKVGIIDTGISDHPDLRQNVNRDLGRRFYYISSGNPVCANIYCNHPDCKETYDTFFSDEGHGTHVAGIV